MGCRRVPRTGRTRTHARYTASLCAWNASALSRRSAACGRVPLRIRTPHRASLSSAQAACGNASMTYIESPPADPYTQRPVDEGVGGDSSLVDAVTEQTRLQNQLFVRYRRP